MTKTNHRVDRIDFTRRLYRNLEGVFDRCADRGFEAVRADFESRFHMAGRKVRVVEIDGTAQTGTALGIDDAGALRIRTSGGRPRGVGLIGPSQGLFDRPPCLLLDPLRPASLGFSQPQLGQVPPAPVPLHVILADQAAPWLHHAGASHGHDRDLDELPVDLLWDHLYLAVKLGLDPASCCSAPRVTPGFL